MAGRLLVIAILVCDVTLLAGCYAFMVAEYRVRPPSLGWSMATVWGVLARFVGVLIVMNAAGGCWWWGIKRAPSMPSRILALVAGAVLFVGGAAYFIAGIAFGLMMQY